jgi:methyl-accepting chemotaxis protein
MKFQSLKIGARLALGFGIVVAIMAIISIIGIIRVKGINELNDRILDDRYFKVMLVTQIQNEVNLQARNLRSAIISYNDAVEVRYALDKVQASVTKNDELFKRLGGSIHSEKGKELFDRMMAFQSAYGKIRDTALKMLADGNSEAGAYLIKDGRSAQNGFFKAIESLAAYQDSLMVADGKQAKADGEAAVFIVVSLAVVGCLIAVLSGVLISRSITRPINQAVVIAQTVAVGDLTGHIDVQGSDEVSLLLQALKQMNENLSQMVGQVRNGAIQIATATREVAHGNMDLSNRTEQQASALEETASSMEELNSTVKHNSDNARQANRMVVSAADVARKGGAVVSEVVTTMAAISQSANKISDIISVIDGIAFQTNILALNAAVEAARAGEQGRGFAVVATEVRNLAHRSAAAAKEIKTLIVDSVERVEEGNRLVAQAGNTMHEVVESVQRVTDIMSEITEAGLEQEAGIEQINQAITEMDSVTQQNAALVEEAAAATGALEEQANALNEVVAAFKLSGESQNSKSTVQSPAIRALSKTTAARIKPRHLVASIANSSAERAKRPAAKEAPTSADWVEF